MKHLDSDLLGLLLALATFFVPVIASFFDKNKKKRGQTADKVGPEVDLEEEVSAEDELKELFDALLKGETQEEEVAQEIAQVEPVEHPAEQVEVMPYAEQIEEAIPQTLGMIEQPSDIVEVEEQHPGLKGKLKENPKDAILMGEVMRPKFKEY